MILMMWYERTIVHKIILVTYRQFIYTQVLCMCISFSILKYKISDHVGFFLLPAYIFGGLSSFT